MRELLPNRRHSETFGFEYAGMGYIATVSRFSDGRLAEIFLANHKAGSHADGPRVTLPLFAQSLCNMACRFRPSGTHFYALRTAWRNCRSVSRSTT